MPHPTLEEPTVATEALEPGDAVLFFTDGALDARDPDGRALGPDGFADGASVGQLLDHRQDHLTDDATFVLVCWKGRP